MTAKANQPANALDAFWETEKILDLALDVRHRARETVRAARRKVKAAKRECKQAKQALRAAEKQLATARKAFRKSKAKAKKSRTKRMRKVSPASVLLSARLANAAKAGTAQARHPDKPPLSTQ